MAEKRIWSVEKFQHHLEQCIKNGVLPKSVMNEWSAKVTYEAYLQAGNKMAKLALLNQLAEILVNLRLRNLSTRFETIVSKTGIPASFANGLVAAYTNPDTWWG
jgi:hypothetical protein